MAPPSISQLERHIRSAAKDAANILVSKHARAQMKKRHISNAMMLDALRKGSIRIQPEPDKKMPDALICRMCRFVAGVDVAIVVSVAFPATGMIVVTAFGN